LIEELERLLENLKPRRLLRIYAEQFAQSREG